MATEAGSAGAGMLRSAEARQFPASQSAAIKQVQRTIPKIPSPPRPPPEKFFCGIQKSTEDLQVHIFDIANGKFGLWGYLGTLSAMKYRQLTWSPVVIRGIPVTPLPNPKSGQPSFFIIRLIDSSNPRYEVDLLFRDTDLYFVGFRRRVVLDSEDEAEGSGKEGDATSKERKKMSAKEAEKVSEKLEKARIKSEWGQWHEFKEYDMKLPSFFNATNCGISSSYCSEATAGGFQSFEEILFVLGTFDEGTVAKDRVQQACFHVMVMLSEASRLRSVFVEVVLRIVQGWSPQVLSLELSDNVDNWTQMGRFVLDARKNGKMDFIAKLDPIFVEKMQRSVKDRKHGLKVLGDLIDETTGELLLINFHAGKLGYTKSEIDEITEQAKQRPFGGPAGRKEADFTHEVI